MGSEWNLYEFVDGRALSNVDPFGNESWFPFPNQGNCYINPITGQRICSPGQPAHPTHVGPVRHTGNKRCIFQMSGIKPNPSTYPEGVVISVGANLNVIPAAIPANGCCEILTMWKLRCGQILFAVFDGRAKSMGTQLVSHKDSVKFIPES